MRLFLLPISTRRTLLYCQKLQVLPTEHKPWTDKFVLRAAKLWAEWQKADGGWKKAVVTYGDKAMGRIPYEEWGLKSVPTLSTRRREEEIMGKEKNEIIFPESVIPATRAPQVLQTLATERESLHRSRLIWCFIGMPISAPLALVPMIPNLPFFYLVFRAWSHYRALAGGKHIQWLLSNKFYTLSPSDTLDAFYPRKLPSGTLNGHQSNPANTELSHQSDDSQAAPERLLLTQDSGRKIAQALNVPGLRVELERAIWQVESALHKESNATTKSPASGESKETKSKEK
ncbi:mitochondrial K+-H+ exchange-related-domain-containing protein [Xylaria sp. CBS 124048]|nr:mitochondrial K+-H+ exchange-related-domain-containing protein [Xylaria sp. CBS 124048]